MNPTDQEILVQNIRAQYTHQCNDLDTLRALDAKVKKPVNVFAYTYGSISAIIMGAGMSLVMTDLGTILGLGSTLIPGVIIGIVGFAMALTTYPIHKKILNRRKQKYAPQILALCQKIQGN